MAARDDERRISVAEERARGGETAAAIELLWKLLSEIAERPVAEEASLSLRRRALEVLYAVAPDDVDVACARARILLPDDVQAALVVIRPALRQSPRSVPVLRVLAEVHRTGGDDEKAVAAYCELLEACRGEIARGRSGLSPRERKRLTDVEEYLSRGLAERAEEHFRPLLERDVLEPRVHRVAAEIARGFNRPPDRGAEHEILSLLLLLAHKDRTARASFQRALGLYPELAILPILFERLL